MRCIISRKSNYLVNGGSGSRASALFGLTCLEPPRVHDDPSLGTSQLPAEVGAEMADQGRAQPRGIRGAGAQGSQGVDGQVDAVVEMVAR